MLRRLFLQVLSSVPFIEAVINKPYARPIKYESSLYPVSGGQGLCYTIDGTNSCYHIGVWFAIHFDDSTKREFVHTNRTKVSLKEIGPELNPPPKDPCSTIHAIEFSENRVIVRNHRHEMEIINFEEVLST